MAAEGKFKRYKTLLTKFDNWPSFLFFKLFGGDSFEFKMKNGFKLNVKKQMLPPFKENFFDEVYLQGFDELKFDKDEPTIIDIGGNVGFFSLFMFSKFSNAKIYTFEPMPFNFGQLNSYNEEFSNYDWTVENKAVAKDDSGTTLYAATLDDFATMSTIRADFGRTKTINVETISLDQIVTKYEMAEIDLLKFDCEGSEYNIMYNASEESLGKIKTMTIETHLVDDESGNHQALLKFIKEKGFKTRDEEVKSDSGYIWAWR